MAKKRSATPDVAGYDKQHGPHATSGARPRARARTRVWTVTTRSRTAAGHRGQSGEPAEHDRKLERLRVCCDQYRTLDGGLTWSTGNMSIEKPLKIGSDPVTVFDVKHGTAIHSSLSYQVQHAAGSQTCDGDLVVSISSDNGLSRS